MRFVWTFAMWLVLLALPFATLAAVDVTMGPSTHARAAYCTRACHDRGCAHLATKVDMSRPVARAAEAVYRANIAALKRPALGYRDTNLLVYLVGFPSVAAALLWAALWRRPTPWSWAALLGAAGLLAGLLAVVASNPAGLLAWGRGRDALYAACTDFCVHMGNLTGLTYEGFNALLFIVGFPGTVLGLVVTTAARLAGRYRNSGERSGRAGARGPHAAAPRTSSSTRG